MDNLILVHFYTSFIYLHFFSLFKIANFLRLGHNPTHNYYYTNNKGIQIDYYYSYFYFVFDFFNFSISYLFKVV